MLLSISSVLALTILPSLVSQEESLQRRRQLLLDEDRQVQLERDVRTPGLWVCCSGAEGSTLEMGL